jgi:hypothetical protein
MPYTKGKPMDKETQEELASAIREACINQYVQRLRGRPDDIAFFRVSAARVGDKAVLEALAILDKEDGGD